MEGQRRAGVTAARLVMLALAVVTSWAAVAAAGGTGHATDVELAGPPAAVVTAAPAPLVEAVTVSEKVAARRARQARRAAASRSSDRIDPRFASCEAARAAGFGPYRRGRDAEYRWYPDADGDGVTCG